MAPSRIVHDPKSTCGVLAIKDTCEVAHVKAEGRVTKDRHEDLSGGPNRFLYSAFATAALARLLNVSGHWIGRVSRE